MSEPKFPNVKIQLVGHDGNAFAILGRMSQALRKGGATQEDVKAFQEEAMSGDYNALLRTCMRWADVS